MAFGARLQSREGLADFLQGRHARVAEHPKGAGEGQRRGTAGALGRLVAEALQVQGPGRRLQGQVTLRLEARLAGQHPVGRWDRVRKGQGLSHHGGSFACEG